MLIEINSIIGCKGKKYKLNLRNPLLLEEYFRVMELFDSILIVDNAYNLWV